MQWHRLREYLRGYVKVAYEIPPTDEEKGFTETVWAKPLGGELYQLENVLAFAEHLNLHDVVQCRETKNGLPVIAEVVRRSGNKTLRVIFREEASDDSCIDVLIELRRRGIFYEKAAFKRYTFNIEPTDDYVSTRDFLKTKETEGLLWLYEYKPTANDDNTS